MLPALEHSHVGFPHHMGEFLVSVELYHKSLDELHHSNKILDTLYGFIFSIPSQLGYKTLSALSVKNCERHFHILFQHFLSVNNFYFSVQDYLLDHSQSGFSHPELWICWHRQRRLQQIIDIILYVISVILELDPTYVIKIF